MLTLQIGHPNITGVGCLHSLVQIYSALTLKVLVATIDAQWEGMGDVGVGEVRAGTTSPMPDHKGFKPQ